MKRSAPIRTSGFTPKAWQPMDHALSREQKVEARAARMANMAEIRRAAPPAARGVIQRVIGAAAPVPKTEAKRCPALLEMAPLFGCLLRVPNVCEGDLEGVVACHSNYLIHGKGRSRKADDQYTVAGCQMCHSWLDQGRAVAAEKEAIFMAAHARQVLEWRRIAQDPGEPPRFRKAAQWALDQLGATAA
jgi:site-specific recombinase XerC